MRVEDFYGWLLAEGFVENTARARLSNCQTVEYYQHVDLDAEYDRDRCEYLIEIFRYTTDDERAGSPARHAIPIAGNIRNGSATYKAAIAKYVSFRSSEENGERIVSCSSQQSSLRGRRVSRAYAAEPNRESYQEFFETFGITPQAVCDFGLDHSVFADPEYALDQWGRLKDDLLNGRQMYIRSDAGNVREFQFYQKLQEYLFNSTTLRRDCTGNYYPRRNLERAVGWDVTIRPQRDTGVLINYQTSHVLSGRTHNPLLYSAVWNIVFTPKIIDPFTGDEAHGQTVLFFQEVFMNYIRSRFAACISDYNNFIADQNIETRINGFQHEDFPDAEELRRFKEAARRQWASV